MKKIIISGGLVAAVAVLATGATIALFSDTETSSGNIFVAGALDLKVDHTAQTYNGVDCKTCSVEIKSDTTNEVVAKNGVPVSSYFASALTFVHPAWTANIPGATWIWEANPVKQADTTVNVSYTFRKTFTWFGPISGATIHLAVASDNMYVVYLNGTQVGADASENNFSSADTIVSIDDNIIQGTNTLEVVVTNKAMVGGTPAGNPAGLLYKLTINGNCGAAYFQNHCELWQSTDLDGSQQFFNFDDIKPGDYGTNVISLRVYDNDAYACLLTSAENDQDNTLEEPEVALNDTASAGELSQFIKVFAWNDSDNDGVYEGEAQLLPPNTPIVNIELLQLSLIGIGPTSYVGLAWCAGTQSVGVNGVVSCSGATMGDVAQTDSFSASLTAYAEQVRNNPNFKCADVNLNSPQ